ncbi:MAG: hypothetical protein ACYC1A_13365 [Spirochaetales bacterium]
MTKMTKIKASPGALLKDLALRASPAFPDFELVFDKGREKEKRRIGTMALALGVTAGIAAGLGMGIFAGNRASLVHEEPLIDSWYQDSSLSSNSTSQPYLAAYLQDLWDSSALSTATGGQ